MTPYIKEKLKEIFEATVESGIKYDGNVNDIKHYDLFCKAASKDRLYKLMGNNLCMFNCEYNGEDAVMMIFYIPINLEDTGAKNVAERVMQVVEETESCFITLDYIKSEEVKEDKFIYIIAVKCL